MGDRWPELPLGLQTLVCSYLTTEERGLLSFWAVTPEDCVRSLEEPTSEWFSHNPDCTVPFLEWLMASCRRQIYLGTRSTPLDILVISWGIYTSSIDVKLYLCEPELEESSDDAKEPIRGVQIGKKNLERMCHVQGGIVHLQVSRPCNGDGLPVLSLSAYQCSNVWQGRYVLVFDHSEYCSLWCLTTSAVVRKICCPSEVCCAYIEDDRRVYIGTEDGRVCIYDHVGNVMLYISEVFFFVSWCKMRRINHLLCLGPRRLLVGSKDSNRLIVVDTEDDQCRPVDTFIGHEDCISCVSLSRDRSVLVSCDFGGGVRVWRVNEGNLVLEYYEYIYFSQQDNCSGLTCCAVSPDGSMVVVYSSKLQTIFLLLRSERYQPVFVPQPLMRIESLSFDPTGRYLACTYTSVHLACWYKPAPSGVYLVDTDCLRKRVWEIWENVSVSNPKRTSFLDETHRLLVLSDNESFYSPTVHMVELIP